MAYGDADDVGHDGVYAAVEHPAYGGEGPGEVGCGDDEYAEQAEAYVSVASAPYVDEDKGEWAGEEGHADCGRDEEQRGAGGEEEPDVLCGAGVGGLLEHARVASEEEEVEDTSCGD